MQPDTKSRIARWQHQCAGKLRKLSRLRPTLGLVLGTGFQHVLSRFTVDARVAYGQLPGFPCSRIRGHPGELFIGRFGGTPVLALSGRAHFYEGHSMDCVTFPVRMLAAYGIRDLLLTNAAGGINPRFRPGDFMSLADHINFMGTNPLRGQPGTGELGFVDLTNTYNEELRRLLRLAARRCGARLHSGIYVAVCGPSYETPAEIRAFARLGADAVGMSTVPEAIVARQCNLRVAGLSCITNLAAGRSRKWLSHAEVLETAERVNDLSGRLLERFAELYGKSAWCDRGVKPVGGSKGNLYSSPLFQQNIS